MAAADKKVLVVGGGGRCHAIVDALSRSPQVAQIFCAPGNAGIAAQATCVPIKDTDVPGLLAFAKSEGIDLTVVGPESSLAAGIADAFRSEGLRIFGHSKAAAQIETSKEFAKKIMHKYGVPTASYCAFDSYEQAVAYVAARPFPAVLKYDGLAAGKGVVIAQNLDEAKEALKDMLLDESFGKGRVVVEDFLSGPEFSFMCFVNGTDVYPMPLAQDHKRAFDGDRGPNTGGMGAYTPLPFITDDDVKAAFEGILCKTAAGMVSEGMPLTGVLYGGLIKTSEGPKVIEFNCRFGDPETEVVLPLLESDAYEVFGAIADGSRIEEALKWSDECVLGVVLASKGYPGSYDKGAEITFAEGFDARVFHMGTALKDGKLVTAGGRVMMVVCKGKTVIEARAKANEAADKVLCDNLFHRTDIGYQAGK